MGNNKTSLPLGDAILKGLLVGGSIGTFAGWFIMETYRAVAMGLICGLLAGVTSWRIQKSRTRK